MSTFKFILKFDDLQGSFSNENGLPLNTIAELFNGLFEAAKSNDNSKMTLSEVRNASQGFVISTPDESEFTTLKIVHKRIREGFEEAPLPRELKYLRALKKVVDSGVTLDSFDESDTFHVRISEVSDFDKERYVSEYKELVGTISEIGGNKILGKRHVRLDEFDFDVVITPEQDNKLKFFYKDQKILFYVKIKRFFNNNDRVRSVELIDFESKGLKSFKSSVAEFMEKRKNVFSEINDSVSAVREIRST